MHSRIQIKMHSLYPVYENKRYRVHQEIEDYTTAKICCISVPFAQCMEYLPPFDLNICQKAWFSKKWVPPIVVTLF